MRRDEESGLVDLLIVGGSFPDNNRKQKETLALSPEGLRIPIYGVHVVNHILLINHPPPPPTLTFTLPPKINLF
jgi:hypothetical protein